MFTVIAAVTLKRSEADLDYHLVLRSGSRTMIAETPSPLCTKGATATLRKQMLAARTRARVCAKARVVGVAFWDYMHGQTGVARNGIELHPVLGFACLSNVGPPSPPPPTGGKCAASYPTVSRRRHRTSTAGTSGTATSACAGMCLTQTRTTSTATTTESAARARSAR